ncbi:hypothetical protein H920_05285 [Fukomys damarensis]|uniref:Uncharacterized protein n=1 Tax=Fukomys damarensis TaxID=885580 RepID=A0A091DPU4_FUKDA|nr:hypothetical protein H920_05285 [Fukomys damarensis]
MGDRDRQPSEGRMPLRLGELKISEDSCSTVRHPSAYASGGNLQIREASNHRGIVFAEGTWNHLAGEGKQKETPTVYKTADTVAARAARHSRQPTPKHKGPVAVANAKVIETDNVPDLEEFTLRCCSGLTHSGPT